MGRNTAAAAGYELEGRMLDFSLAQDNTTATTAVGENYSGGANRSLVSSPCKEIHNCLHWSYSTYKKFVYKQDHNYGRLAQASFRPRLGLGMVPKYYRLSRASAARELICTIPSDAGAQEGE